MSAPEQDPIGQDLDEYLAGPDPDYTADVEPPQEREGLGRYEVDELCEPWVSAVRAVQPFRPVES